MPRSSAVGRSLRAAIGATVAAAISATADSGPRLSHRLRPMSGYRMSGMRATVSPALAPTPASSPYAIAWGTR